MAFISYTSTNTGKYNSHLLLGAETNVYGLSNVKCLLNRIKSFFATIKRRKMALFDHVT